MIDAAAIAAEIDAIDYSALSIRPDFIDANGHLNVGYYMGDQWLFWNRGRLDRPQLEPWRITLTDNRIIGIVNTELAKMTKQKPVWQVVPVTAEDSDLEASRLGEQILERRIKAGQLVQKRVVVIGDAIGDFVDHRQPAAPQ